MKKILFFSMLVGLNSVLFGQQTLQMDKVPKQVSLDGAYLYGIKNEMGPEVKHGYTLMFDYGWQLSGFNMKRSGFITVPIGYSMVFSPTDPQKSIRVLTYGWTVRHELRPQSGWVPYLGYGLMLSQYAEKGVEGRIIGHLTRFSFGCNYYQIRSFVPFIELDYGMTNYPEWGVKGSRGLNFIETRIGIRYLR